MVRLLSVEQAPSGISKIWHFKEEVPHAAYLLSLVVGEYEELHEEYDDIMLEYYPPRQKE